MSLHSFFEAATSVYEGVISFVKVLLQSEGVSVSFKIAYVHLKDATI